MDICLARYQYVLLSFRESWFLDVCINTLNLRSYSQMIIAQALSFNTVVNVQLSSTTFRFWLLRNQNPSGA